MTVARYAMAEDLNRQLDDLSRNLSQMIGEVNKLSAPAPSAAAGARSNGSADQAPTAGAAERAGSMPDDPINQLSAILGAHLRALGNIDAGTERLEGKVSELEGRAGRDSRSSRR